MAFISDGSIVLECGRVISFENIFPIKIVWPYALMSDYTAYNIIEDTNMRSGSGTRAKIDDIFYICIDGCDQKLMCYAKINVCAYFVNSSINLVSSECFYHKRNITSMNLVKKSDGDYTSIFSDDKVVLVENNSVFSALDKNCKYIHTNITGHVLQIYLLKKRCIKIYDLCIDTNIVTLKQTINMHVIVNKCIKHYFIDDDGLLYVIVIDDNGGVGINKIETEYRFYDINPTDLMLDKFLLLTFDNIVVSYGGNNTFTSLDKYGRFCLEKNQTKSAKI